MRQNPCLFLLLTLSASLSAPAQDETSAAEDFFADSPLILTVSRMAKPLFESPASVSVIDRQMIESSGVREIADIFRLVPGFVVGYHSGHAPAVSYHGLGQEFGRHIQVLIDGRSVFIPSFGGVPWSNLPLLIEDIERIEVIRGPNAVTYGANAFLATINIITRHAAEDIGSYASVTSSDNANPDIEDAYLRVGNQHEGIDWRLSLGTLNDGGFNGINDSKRVGKVNFRMDLQARSNQFWTLQLGTSESELGRGFPPSSDTLTNIERSEEASNSYLNLQWEGVWDSSTTIARLTNTRQEVTDNYDPGPFPLDLGPGPPINGVTTYIDFDRISERTDLELIHTDDVGDNVRLVYGGSLRRDKVKSRFLFNDNSFHEVDTGRLFGGVEWRFDENWLLDLGIMLEDSSLTSMEESPRISLIRQFGKAHALRLVASKANRNPILWEAEGETEFTANLPGPPFTVAVPTWLGNDDIDPEEIESYEIGLRSRIRPGLETDIKFFTYEITEQFVSSEVTVATPFGPLDVESNANGGETEVNGIEVALDYRQGPFALNTGFSRVTVESNDDEFEDSIPQHTAFLGASYQINSKHEVSGVLYYVDEISWLDSGTDVPIARRLDLRYAYRFENGISIEIIGQNLLEDFKDYEEENVHDQVVFLKLSGGI
ncbi:MAG: TonB-dependent receptor [Gammaproteobacteria bacterium]|nr:TonB-dependent receptor [Gammaproteobacteria bacterium]